MTTRSDLRELCRRRLGDLSATVTFSDLQINQWINDALADLSINFPRQDVVDITTAAADHVYNLPGDFQSAVSVEYPQGENPPEYLTLRNETDPGFWESDLYYHIRPKDGSTVWEIIVSAETALSETIRVTYLADHDWLDDDTDVTTLHDRYLDLLVLFVRWAATQELATSEARDPDPANLQVSVLDTNAGRAERIYRTALRAAIELSSRSSSVVWTGYDRIY